MAEAQGEVSRLEAAHAAFLSHRQSLPTAGSGYSSYLEQRDADERKADEPTHFNPFASSKFLKAIPESESSTPGPYRPGTLLCYCTSRRIPLSCDVVVYAPNDRVCRFIGQRLE